jgi:DNA primase
MTTDEVVVEFPGMPADAIPEIPAPQMRWLLQYHLTLEQIKKHQIQWSASEKRLIFPVRTGSGKYLGWVGRDFSGEPNRPKWKAVGPLHSEIVRIGSAGGKWRLVVVEDIVSAIRVSAITHAVPLFGTHMNQAVFSRLCQIADTVTVWLDEDRASEGLALALKISKWVPANVVITPLDPKEYTNDVLKQYLSEISK